MVHTQIDGGNGGAPRQLRPQHRQNLHACRPHPVRYVHWACLHGCPGCHPPRRGGMCPGCRRLYARLRRSLGLEDRR
jgi:hypothetical protein